MQKRVLRFSLFFSSKPFRCIFAQFICESVYSIIMERKIAHICVFLLVLDFSVALQTPKPCRPLETQYGTVCKSDDNYCDSLEMEEPQDEEYILVITSGEGDRFYYEKGDLCAQYLANKFVPDAKTILEIDSTTTYQTMQGFGGAWTGTVTTLINEISENLQNCVFSSYFSSDVGMSYSIIRIPIGGCDFDKKPWAYNEYPENDIQLSNFTTLDERDLMRNEQFRELTKISKNQNINYLGTAWSAPRWMKQNDQWFGLLNSQIKPKYYQTWADYHLKWLKLMNGDGIDIWAISTGNQPWFSLLNSVPIGTGWIASYQALWIAEFLGPTLETSKYAKVQIHGFDDNRLSALGWLQEMSNSNQKAFDYLSAIDFHGYADQLTTPDILDEVQSQFPYKQIWYSEMSLGTVSIGADLTAGPLLGSWLRAEELVTIIMNNLNHSTVGYIDKNLILDYQGGPNSVAAYADAPVILSADLTELYAQIQNGINHHYNCYLIDVK